MDQNGGEGPLFSYVDMIHKIWMTDVYSNGLCF